jgi:hypothetical protein
MHPFYFAVWGPGKIVFKLYFRWEIYGVEHIPLQGGGLIVSNHASLLDPVLLGTSPSWRGFRRVVLSTCSRRELAPLTVIYKKLALEWAWP